MGVFGPQASVTAAALLEIDRNAAQSLWGPPDIHLLSPFFSHSSNRDTLFVCKQTKKLTHMLNRAV